MSEPLSQYCTDLIRQCAELPAGLGTTYAMVVYRDGEVVAEHYNGTLPGSERVVAADVPLLSWSMAKSVVQTLLGLAHDDGILDVDGTTNRAFWTVDDPRSGITIRQLLQMSSGLEWHEEYTTDVGSDVIEMLFGASIANAASFAAQKPLVASPGTLNSYSSGTTNILCRLLEYALQQHQGINIATYINQRLFSPLGVTFNPIDDVRFDGTGLWLGSSFLYLRAQDWLRFGLLYLNNGLVDGRRVLNQRWVSEAQTPAVCAVDGDYGYSNHWWLWPTRSATPDAFAALGYQGQHVIVVPSKNAVVVRLGSTPDESKHLVRAALHRVIEAL